MKYIINYNNGSPERNTADTLEEAMRIADENVCFSGSMNGITIEDEDGNSIMGRRRTWPAGSGSGMPASRARAAVASASGSARNTT